MKGIIQKEIKKNIKDYEKYSKKFESHGKVFLEFSRMNNKEEKEVKKAWEKIKKE